MSKLLVTGAAGFIGANFVHYWVKKYPNDLVVGLDSLTYAGNRASVPTADNFKFVHEDICNSEKIQALIRTHDIDTLVHFAAESHVDRSITGPDAFIETNILGTYSLLKAAREEWLQGKSKKEHRFHHVSTDEVFGSLEPGDDPFKETTPYAPNSPYSASKAASDHLVRAYHHTYGLNVTTSNCSNNYGPFQFPEKLIPLVLLNILHGKELPIYGDGSNVRDWLYVDDHVRGIELILDKGELGETYNIGGHNEWTNINIVNLICDTVDGVLQEAPSLMEKYPETPLASGRNARDLIAFVKDRPGHDRRYAIDATKTTKELGYKPVETFQTGMAKTIRWYLDNEEWWEAILDGRYRDWIEKQYN